MSVNDTLNSENLKNKIDDLLKNTKTVLFMKGDKEMPACGFSASVVEMLKRLGVEFTAVNILVDDTLRAFMKEYSNWPTYPQIYHNGELIGGYDIAFELYENGELAKILAE